MKPVIGITMGDPASIGPEITLKAFSDDTLFSRCRPIVIGDSAVLEKAKQYTGLTGLKIHPVVRTEDALFLPGIIDVFEMHQIDIEKLEIGKISEMAGNAAFSYVKKVIELAMEGKIDATVTNALNKEAMNLAGHHFAGHTEIYAEFTSTRNYTMMLAYQNVRVVHVSTHVSLREACDRAKKERIMDVIQIAQDACLQMGIREPKIGVAGLNPHCGERGLFGREEIEEIRPAVEEMQRKGIHADGPIPADTIFSKAKGGWYDIVVAMYHDQGHIPLKVLGFDYDREAQQWKAVEGVNITLGLPIIRTSVDHGTAFDQAGSGLANELSLVNAIDYAIGFAVHGPKNLS